MTFDEVDDQLTLPRYNALCRFWSKQPPSAVLLAGYVGYKGRGQQKQEGEAEEIPVEKFDWDAPQVVEEMDDESMAELGAVFGIPLRAR